MALAYDDQNIFARILRGELSSHQIFEDEHAIAILDAFPICPGHALLLPKTRCASMLDMPAEVASAYLSSLPKLASIVQRATGAPGIKIIQNSGAEAGQIVFHCHFHVIPRFGTGNESHASSGPLKPEDATQMLLRMRSLAVSPYSRVLAALDNLAAEMRRGDVRLPAGSKSATAISATAKLATAKSVTTKSEAAKSVGGSTPAAAKPTADKVAAANEKSAAARTPSKPVQAAVNQGKPMPNGAPGTAAPPGGMPAAVPPGGNAAAGLAGDKAAKKEAKEKAAAKAVEKAAAKAAVGGGGAGGVGAAGGGGVGDRAVDVSWLDIRVGHIIAAEAHPDSDKLYVETIDVGEPTPRQVLSGLAQHLPIDSVRGARVLVLCNLAYKKMGGVESQGMVLCAKAAGGGLAFVSPQVSSTPGTRISVDGYPGDPELNPKKMAKKKAWEACMPELATDANGIACYKGIPFRLPEGVCAAEGIANAPIS